MDQHEELQKQIEEAKSLREQFQAQVLLTKELKEKLDAAYGRVALLVSKIKAASDEELRTILAPSVENGRSSDSKSTIDSLVEVLEACHEWMSIQGLTQIALEFGVHTKSANPARVFSTALSNERGKDNPKVVLLNNKWGLPGWRRRRVRRKRTD